jgi:hypothetical protein
MHPRAVFAFCGDLFTPPIRDDWYAYDFSQFLDYATLVDEKRNVTIWVCHLHPSAPFEELVHQNRCHRKKPSAHETVAIITHILLPLCQNNHRPHAPKKTDDEQRHANAPTNHIV